MNQPLTIPVKDNSGIRILQLTDPHLFADRQQMLLGVNTWDSLIAVVEEIAAADLRPDLIVLTGDMAQQPSLAAYTDCAKAIAPLGVPCVWLPGNHDVMPLMQQAFLHHPAMTDARRVLLGEKWQLVLLNSQVNGDVYGLIDEAQLTQLDSVLAAEPERYTLLSCHHHVVPCHCAWLDQHRLKNAADFSSVMQRYPQIKGLIFGHIHQEMDIEWRGKRILATPSTCVQFKPNCDSFTLDHGSPGWRWITLLPSGELKTEVHRLTGKRFSPDMHAKGY